MINNKNKIILFLFLSYLSTLASGVLLMKLFLVLYLLSHGSGAIIFFRDIEFLCLYICSCGSLFWQFNLYNLFIKRGG